MRLRNLGDYASEHLMRVNGRNEPWNMEWNKRYVEFFLTFDLHLDTFGLRNVCAPSPHASAQIVYKNHSVILGPFCWLGLCMDLCKNLLAYGHYIFVRVSCNTNSRGTFIYKLPFFFSSKKKKLPIF